MGHRCQSVAPILDFANHFCLAHS